MLCAFLLVGRAAEHPVGCKPNEGLREWFLANWYSYFAGETTNKFTAFCGECGCVSAWLACSASLLRYHVPNPCWKLAVLASGFLCHTGPIRAGYPVGYGPPDGAWWKDVAVRASELATCILLELLPGSTFTGTVLKRTAVACRLSWPLD